MNKDIARELRILLRKYESDSRSVITVDLDDNSWCYEGLCIVAISRVKSSWYTRKYIEKNVPYGREKYGGYAWNQQSKRGRIAWLKKHIDKLEA